MAVELVSLRVNKEMRNVIIDITVKDRDTDEVLFTNTSYLFESAEQALDSFERLITNEDRTVIREDAEDVLEL